MLLFEDDNGPIGQFNWFAVHPTAMNNTNTLINGDSKGWASNMIENEFERQVSTNQSNRSAITDRIVREYLIKREEFVAGFGSTNLGDISPNILARFLN